LLGDFEEVRLPYWRADVQGEIRRQDYGFVAADPEYVVLADAFRDSRVPHGSASKFVQVTSFGE
jgi:hypothetical protein